MASENIVRLTMGEERVTVGDVTRGKALDLKNRDPESLHDNLGVFLITLLLFIFPSSFNTG